MRGSFDKDPQRRRKDADGAAPFNPEPPQHLPTECVRAWRWIVERLPKVTIYSTDEIAVEIAARSLTVYWLNGDPKAEKSLQHWMAKLGFSPQDRTKLAPASNGEKNEFDEFDH